MNTRKIVQHESCTTAQTFSLIINTRNADIRHSHLGGGTTIKKLYHGCIRAYAGNICTEKDTIEIVALELYYSIFKLIIL